MKRIYNIFILLCLFTNIASAIPQLTSFTVKPNFLQNGKIKVYNNGTTEFRAQISASRGMNGTTYESVLAEVVFYMQIGSVQHELKTITLTSSYFSGSYLATYNEEGGIPAANNLVVIAIPQNIETGEVKVKYRYKDANDVWQPNSTYGYENYSQSYYQTINVGTTPYPPVIAPSIIAKIQAMGFSTEGIQYRGNAFGAYYVVEGDVLIKTSSLNETSTFYAVNNEREHNINIWVKGSVQFNSTWLNGILGAVSVWNSNPTCDIKLHLVYQQGTLDTPPPYDIAIEADQGILSSDQVSLAEYPTGDGKAGKLIIANLDYSFGSSSVASDIFHAIGHTLGIKHQITTYLLDESVINVMYPLNPNSLVLPYISGKSNLSANVSENYEMSYYVAGLNYNWNIIGINGTADPIWYPTTQSRLPENTFGVNGNYQVQCSVSHNKYNHQIASATKNVVVQ